MVLMGIMMSLVGPLANNVVAKAQAQTERLQLESLIKRSSFRAFASGRGGVIDFFDNQVVGEFVPKKQEVVTFETLHFPNQRVTFSKSGFPQSQQLIVELPNRTIRLNLLNIIDGEGQVIDAKG